MINPVKVAGNFFKGIGSDISKVSKDKDVDVKFERITSITLRVLGVVGMAASAALVISAFALTGPVGIVAALALAALGFALSHDLIVMGQNSSKQVNDLWMSTLDAPIVMMQTRRPNANIPSRFTGPFYEPAVLKNTWLIKPVSDFFDRRLANQSHQS